MSEFNTKKIGVLTDGVHVNSNAGYGVAGTDWPIGTPGVPVSNIADAQTIAVARKLRKLYLTGDFTLAANLSNYVVIGNSELSSDPAATVRTYIDFNGKAVSDCIFRKCVITDLPFTSASSRNEFQDCCISYVIVSSSCFFKNCRVDVIWTKGLTYLFDCFGDAGLITLSASGTTVHVINFKGRLQLQNMEIGNDPTVHIYGSALRLYFHNTCVTGTANIYDNVEVIDNSVGTTVNDYSIQARQKQFARVAVTAASANLKNSNNAEKTTASLTYVRLKEIILNTDMAGIRIKFDLKTSNVLGTAYGKIYKNGVAVGAEQTDITGIYATKSEDLTGFVKGDKLQLRAKISNALYTAYVRNFQLFYDFSDTLSVTNNDP